MFERKETKRKRILSVKVFPDELETLRKVAHMNGQTMSEFIRQAALQKRREYEKEGVWA